MEQSSSKIQMRICRQFDSFCKIVLKNEAIDYERERKRLLRHEVSFSELRQGELVQLQHTDEYAIENEIFRVLSYEVEVKDELLGEALRNLPEKKRDVILMSFFMDMSDTEIGKQMNLVRSTIHHHRESSLQILKKLMEELENDENK